MKAATINDDNLIIIEGDRNLAVAYAINIISTCNHLWWRHNMAPASVRRKAKAVVAPIAGPGRLTSAAEWSGLNSTDAWQDKFYAAGAETSEARFWGVQA